MNTLFDSTNIGMMHLKNRFFRASTWESMATENGHLTDELCKIYIDLAKGGVGTILTGYTYVLEEEHPHPRMMGIYDDSFIPEYKALTDSVHSYHANIVLQIVYGGSWTRLNPPSPKIWGPSAVKHEQTGVIPTAMTKTDMRSLASAFAAAARRAKAAGFDGIELHAAHGYLLSQFLSPHYNVRTDEYGGSVENRTRFIG